MFHILEPVPNWLEAVKILPRGAAVKAIAVQWLSEAKNANPNIFTIHRYINNDIQDINPDDTDEIRANRARDWFDRFIDGTFLNGETAGIPHWRATDAISFWNEYYSVSQTPEEKELWWRQERITAQVWYTEYRPNPKLNHIRLAICACPVGNDIPLMSANTADIYDCILDYHGYDKFVGLNVRDPLSWEYHCGRWDAMDAGFRMRGYECDWFLGESGPYATVVDGWKSSKVLGGDREKYVEAVREFVREIKGTNVYQTGRFKGFALFTTGGNWPKYATSMPEMGMIAEMLAEEMGDVPTPPEPKPEVRKVRVVTGIGWLNLRTGPGMSYEDIGDLEPGGGPLEVTGEDGDWLQVAGWAHRDWLEDCD